MGAGHTGGGWCPTAAASHPWRGGTRGFASRGDQWLGAAVPIFHGAEVGGEGLGRRRAGAACHHYASPAGTAAAANGRCKGAAAAGTAAAVPAATDGAAARSLGPGAAAGARLWGPLAAIVSPCVGAASSSAGGRRSGGLLFLGRHLAPVLLTYTRGWNVARGRSGKKRQDRR